MTDTAAASDPATYLSAIEDELASPQLTLGDPHIPLAPHADRLRTLGDSWRRNVKSPLGVALKVVPDDVAKNVRLRVATCGALIAARLAEAGDPEGAAALLVEATQLCPPGRLHDTLDGAQREPRAFATLIAARDCLDRDQRKQAKALLKPLAGAGLPPALEALRRELATAPPPMTSAPTLTTINGIGTMLYGRGDQRDGTWVATRFFTFVFIPLWPIDAWRVRSEGDRAWRFFGRERIGPKARAMRWAVLGLLGCALLFGALGSWRDSPRRLAAQAIAEARALEEAGDSDGALRAYRAAFETWAREPRGDLVKPAATGIVRILASRIDVPASADDTTDVAQLLTTWRQLTPSHARGSEAADLLNDAVGTWCLALSPEQPDDASAMVRIANAAIDAGLTDPRHEQCLSRARIAEADAWAQGWPGDALDAFAAIDGDEARRRAVEMLDAIAGNAELLAQHADAVQATLPHAPAALADRVAATRAADRARAADPVRIAALAARGDELAAWVAEHPTDQYAVLAHADGLLAAGRVDDAVLAVHNVGAPGATMRSLLHLRVAALSQGGDTRAALDIVRHLRRVRLPRYLEVSMAWDERGNALIEDIDRRASEGTLPADVMDRLLALDGDAQGAAFNQYVMERLQTDAQLSALREQLDELSDGFMAAMQQGSLALELANASTGDAREALLAEAEDAYMAIRTEGAGMPEWHLGMARVYFRLGRTEQAEEQLAQVSSSLDPMVLGQVSETLRELGLTLRARETSQRALGLAQDDDTRAYLSIQLHLLASTLDESERVLTAAPDTPLVQGYRRDVRAQRLLLDGDAEGAAALYLEAARELEDAAAVNPVAANNLSVAWSARFVCTGDVEDLERAVEAIASATRGEPDSAIVATNAAGARQHLAVARALERFMPLDGMMLGPDDLVLLASAVGDGAHADRWRAALTEGTDYAGAVAEARRATTLAPQDPSTWRTLYELLMLTRDDEALQRVEAQLEHVELDVTAGTAQWNDWLGGVHDTLVDQAQDRAIDRARQRVAALGTRATAEQRDAAHYLLATALYSRFAVRFDPDDLAEAVAAVDQVRGDTFAVYAPRSTFIVGAQLAELARGDDELAAQLRQASRESGLTVHAALRFIEQGGPGAQRVRAALTDDTLARALEEAYVPSSTGWVLATLMGDTQAMTTHAAWVERPAARVAARLDSRLSPWDARKQLVAELADRIAR